MLAIPGRAELPMKLLLLGLGFLIVGLALPFLMVIQILDPSLVLSFLAYAASLTGLALGVWAIVQLGSFKWRARD